MRRQQKFTLKEYCNQILLLELPTISNPLFLSFGDMKNLLSTYIMEQFYFIYIGASPSDVLYIGVMNNLIRRMQEHREGTIEGFSKKYGCTRLLYYESGKYIYDAIAREKELKGWTRKRKIALIETMNPTWKDLYGEITL